MPSTSVPTVAWPGKVLNHFFPSSMWTTWPSHNLLSPYEAFYSWLCTINMLGGGGGGGTIPSSTGSECMVALLCYTTCSCTTTTAMSCHSWQPCRDSTIPIRWANWTCWRSGPPFPPQVCVSACKVRSSCFTSLSQLTLTSVSLIVGELSIVFMRCAEAGTTTIQMPDYGAKALPCHSLAGYNANSLGFDMPITSGVSLNTSWALRLHGRVANLFPITAGVCSNSWPMRQLCRGCRACCMVA